MVRIHLGALSLLAYSSHNTGKGVFSKGLCGKPHCLSQYILLLGVEKACPNQVEFLKWRFYGEAVSLVTGYAGRCC